MLSAWCTTGRYEWAWFEVVLTPPNPFFADSAEGTAISCGARWDRVDPTGVGKVGVEAGGEEFSRRKNGCCNALKGLIRVSES